MFFEGLNPVIPK